MKYVLITFWKSRRELFTNFQYGRLRLGFLVAVIAYNWTEAAFKNISTIWFVFCIIAMDSAAIEAGTGDAVRGIVAAR
jgi:exopolysaccharide production protein ExoQ